MTATHRLACGVVALLALLAGSSPALAQERDPVEDARAHFQRGMEFFNEGRYDAALAEFQRAYELAPAHQVLYNVARVHEALGHAVESADAYDQYLRDSGDRIPAARRREVEQALARQRARIAEVTIQTNVEGATITVDGVDVATTPMGEPLRLSAGEHTIGARAAGYDSIRRAVRLAGGDRRAVSLELSPLVDQRGTLRIVSSVPDVEVRLGDRVLGRTPLASTVPVAPGEHTIIGRRAGYREARVRIDVEAGSETEVELEMETAEGAPGDAIGQLRIHLPDSPAVVRVDGEPVILRGAGLTLPVGRHRVSLEVAEREPFETMIEIPAGEGVDLRPELLWTPAARAERVAAAQSTRTWGMVVTIGGGLVLLGGGGVFLWNESEIAKTDDAIIDVQRQFNEERCLGGGGSRCDTLREQGNELNADRDRQDVVRIVSSIVAAAGAIVTVVGVVLWASAPTEEDIDDAAHASVPSLRLRAGLGSLALEGTF